MILVDTSIWVEHLRRGRDLLSLFLGEERVLSHPFVVGELALGGAPRAVIDSLLDLPRAMIATDDEVLDVIARQNLAGRGIGYVDAHLLVSASLMGDVQLWTFDRRLRGTAEALGLCAQLAN